MKTITNGMRVLSGAIAFTLAVTLASSPVMSQDEGGDDDDDGECVVYGEVTFDGEWLCFEHLICDDGDIIGEDVCIKIN